MSGEEGDDGGPGRREVAYRLFAAEFEDADFSYAESDEERAPNYVVTPTGARVNRMFVVGVLTEVEAVGSDILRARVVDPTGAVVVYAGQYQPEAQTFFERADPPMFLAVSGKARTFQPDDSDVIYTSLRPESVNTVDAETRDRWTVRTAEQTLDRIGVMAGGIDADAASDALRAALESAGVDEGLAAGVPLALDHYGTTGTYLSALRDLALDATRVVAGQRKEAGQLTTDPGDGGSTDVSALSSLSLATPDTSPTADDAPSAGEASTGSATPDSESSTEKPVTTGSPADTASQTSETVSSGADAPDSASASTTTETTSTEPTTDTETTGDEPVRDAGGSSETDSDADVVSPSATDTETTGDEPTPTETVATSDESTAGDASPTDMASDAEETGTAADDEDVGDFEPGEFDLDEETREEVESEYGTDFQSGMEVDDPGSADIETPDPDDLAEAEEEVPQASDAGVESPSVDDLDTSTDADATDPEQTVGSTDAESLDTSTDTTDAEPTVGDTGDDGAGSGAEDVDLEDAAMNAIEDLDDGSGADHEAVVEAVVDRTGADADAVEDGIQSALMSGRCYEPDDTTLKSI